MPLHVVTASRLRDGAIMWRASAGGWTEHFPQAAPFPGDAIDAALEAGQADVRTQQVIGVYKVAVTETRSGLAPESVRERIRARGPSVRPDFMYPGA